jgi:hypothetical protein
MTMRTIQALVCALLLAMASLYCGHASAAQKIDCEMKFSLTGWSALYKHAEGKGVVTCTNGKSYPVTIVAVGGGLTVGKYKVEDGTGKFSEVFSTDEIFGSYAQGEAEAGLVKSAMAQVLTKGNVSLALAGTGGGVNIGISFGKFTITKTK